MSKKIMLFDVDGTIAESGLIMDDKIAELLNKISILFNYHVQNLLNIILINCGP